MGLADPGDLDDLSWLLAPAPGEPATPSVDQRLSAGRGALRRRRLAVGTATLVALGAVGLGAAAVGATAPSTRSLDPAGGPTPTVTAGPSPSTEEPAPDRDAPPGPPASPDVIGEARTASPAEVRAMRDYPGYPVSLGDDGNVILLPGWEVLDRFDDLGSRAALNLQQDPDTVRDAVGVSIAPAGGTASPTYYFLEMGRDGLIGATEQVPNELDGSIAFWATQKVWAGTPRTNGTPGPDVRLRIDGMLEVDQDVQVLEARSDPDLGGLVRGDAELSLAARVRLPDGRVQFVVLTKGAGYDSTLWFHPEPAPEDLRAFAALVRQVYGEEPL